MQDKIKGLLDVFPEQKPINRTLINGLEDPNVTGIVEKSGRKQLIIAGLFSEICLAMPAIQALGKGIYEKDSRLFHVNHKTGGHESINNGVTTTLVNMPPSGKTLARMNQSFLSS